MRALLLPILLILPFTVSAAANPDADFFKHAAEGGMSEVDLGNLAQSKSHDPLVQEFGAMMVKDHSAANEKLKSVAAAKNIVLPTSPSVGQMATKTKLEVLSGDTFDKSYIKDMISDHEEDIAEFNKEATSGRDPDAKAFAVATLPTLKTHLQRIKTIARSAGVTANSNSAASP
jgi:putative membrane protein